MSKTIRTSSWIGGAAVGTAAVLVTTAAAFGGGTMNGGAIPVRSAPEIRGVEYANPTAPPAVPAPIERDHATRVVVELEVQEKIMEIAPGTDYTFWTFGGTVPGRFIRVREGDLVEMRLKNAPDSKALHNIDLHAVTGPHGGGSASYTNVGGETVFTFTALNPGLYVYHCATAPVGMHIANGMYGMILVEPEEGLPEVDREYYVMQGDFYTTGDFGAPGLQAMDYDKALAENPTYVLFNGAVGSLRGENALTAERGETVRLFVGNGGPNLVSSFHVIGEIFDNVYREAGSALTHDVQTTLIPAGGASIVEMRVDVPGTFLLVDHSILRATDKGAMGELIVGGEEDLAIFDASPGGGAVRAEH